MRPFTDDRSGFLAGDRIRVLGLPVDRLTWSQLLRWVDRLVSRNEQGTVLYLNVHVANCAAKCPALQRALEKADVVYCDGEGIRLGAAVLGHFVPPRLTGADFVWDLAAHAAVRGYPLFWVGGRPGVAARALERLRQRVPGLPAGGSHHGYFDAEGFEGRAVVETINAHNPTILLVGLGTPKQELWVRRHRSALRAPVVWCIGATADFIVGTQRRAPAWMASHGLEWLHRLAQSPGRLGHRYVIGNPWFMARVLRERYLRTGR